MKERDWAGWQGKSGFPTVEELLAHALCKGRKRTSLGGLRKRMTVRGEGKSCMRQKAQMKWLSGTKDSCTS